VLQAVLLASHRMRYTSRYSHQPWVLPATSFLTAVLPPPRCTTQWTSDRSRSTSTATPVSTGAHAALHRSNILITTAAASKPHLAKAGDDSRGWPKEFLWGAVAGQWPEDYILPQVLKIPVHRNKLHMDSKWTWHLGVMRSR
jgi:hypothetical protein